MYPTSAAYKAAIDTPNRLVQLRGSIVLGDGTVFQIDDEDILQGSLYTREQSVASDDFEIGNVIAAEMGFGLILSERFSGVAFETSDVNLEFGIEVSPGLFEFVPLGLFKIVEAKRKESIIDIKAFDNIILLDINLDGVRVSGTPFQFLEAVCKKAGIKLGNTENEIESMPNGARRYELPLSNDVETCRDLVGWLAQLLACFARMNRQGELEFVGVVNDVTTTIDADSRFNTSIADFRYNITKLSMVSGKTLYESISSNDGNHLELEENPFLTDKIPSTRKHIIDGIFDQVSQVAYTPFELEYFGDPSVQPGDYIRLTGGVAQSGITGLITHSTWRYRGKHKLKSAGADPLLRVKNSNSRGRGSDGGTNLVLVKNQSAMNISTSFQKVLNINISLFASTNAQAGLALVGLASENGVLLEGYFDLNGERLSTEIYQVLHQGWNTIGLPFIVTQIQSGSHELRLFLKTSTGTFNLEANRAELFVVAENLLGGMSSSIPRADVIEEVRFISSIKVDDEVSAETKYPTLVGNLTENVAFSEPISVSDVPSILIEGVEYDTEPPAMPTGVVATTGYNSIALEWEPNTEISLAGYNVYVDDIKYNNQVIEDNSINISALQNGETYNIKLTAITVWSVESEPFEIDVEIQEQEIDPST